MRPPTRAQIRQSHGESPMQGTDEGQDHRTVGKQRIAPEPGVVRVDKAGGGQDEKRQQSSVTEQGDAEWNGIGQ